MKWLPAWGHDRMHEMIAGRPDWCISRQRFWGVPLIVFYCDACGKQLKDADALRHVLPFFEREGADAWFTHSAEELLPPGTKCSLRRARSGGRNRTFWMCGSIPVRRISLCSLVTISAGRLMCISKAPTSIADGSKARCW